MEWCASYAVLLLVLCTACAAGDGPGCQAPAPVPGGKGCGSILTDTDFDGNDVKPVHAISTPDAASCCALCRNSTACKVWTWQGEHGSCYLKTSAAGRQSLAAAVSGCVLVDGACPVPIPGAGLQADFDCKMRNLAVEYARYIQPHRPDSAILELAEALAGSTEAAHPCCINVTAATSRHTGPPRPASRFNQLPIVQRGGGVDGGLVLYVDAKLGSDSNPGTVQLPLQTIPAALAKTRASPGADTIVLRAGTFYFAETMVLTRADSGLAIQSYPGEEAWLSGAHPLSNLVWESHNTTAGANIWKTQLPPWVPAVTGLRLNGQRLTRARFPNANPETDGFMPPAVFRAGWTKQSSKRSPDVQIDLPSSTLSRNTTVSMFQTFTAGIGGTCDRFDPPAGYWCSNNVAGGGSVIYFVPTAMHAPQTTLPNTPYQNATGAIVQTWRPGHWASWMYEVGSATYDAATKTTNFTFSAGGFQGSRGSDEGEDTYIENVFEELDAPGEFFFDEVTSTLYLYHNATSGTKPPADGFGVPTVKSLFNITGTMAAPVSGVTLAGLGLRDTAYTYMDPHGIPSGGDWTLERSAVVFLEGTTNVTLHGNVFERVDGNAVLLSAFNRGAQVVHNEFVWIGATAVAMWGNTDGGDSRLPAGYGYDGSSGNQPRNNTIAFNLCHELGVWEKQSSFYTQFKASANNVYANIVYNGPRAHVNFNDGFRGGARVEKNLLFNSCRESGDHGPFNSWDRDPYWFDDMVTGERTTVKALDTIASNFVIADYNSLGAVDNDDGSSYYLTRDNFFVYGGGGLKNDFEGNTNYWINNVIAFTSRYALHNGYGGIVGQPGKGFLPGHEDRFINNTFVWGKDGEYARPICSGNGVTLMAGNQIFTPTGNVTECGMSLAAWQAKGHEQGTVAQPYTATMADDLIAAARLRLFAA